MLGNRNFQLTEAIAAAQLVLIYACCKHQQGHAATAT